MPLKIAAFIFLFYFSGSTTCTGQTPKIDSLKKVLLAGKEDTARANILISLGKKYIQRSNFDSALMYCNHALELSKKFILNMAWAAHITI